MLNDLSNFGQGNDIEFIIFVRSHVFKPIQWYLNCMRLFATYHDRHFYRVKFGRRRNSTSFLVQVLVNFFLDRKSLDNLPHVDANVALGRPGDLAKEDASGVEQVEVIARLLLLPRIVEHNLIFVFLLAVLAVVEVQALDFNHEHLFLLELGERRKLQRVLLVRNESTHRDQHEASRVFGLHEADLP